MVEKFYFHPDFYYFDSWENYPIEKENKYDKFVPIVEHHKYLQEFLDKRMFVLDFQFFGDEHVSRNVGCHGIGDVLIYSGIPEAIKKDEKKLFDKVYIRNHFCTKYGWDENLIKSVFADNPYIDGYIDYPYTGLLTNFPAGKENMLKSPLYTSSTNFRNIQDFFLDYIGVIPIEQKNDIKPKIYHKGIRDLKHLNNSVVIDLNSVSANRFYDINNIMKYLSDNNVHINFELIFENRDKRRNNQISVKPYYPQMHFKDYLEYFSIISSVKEIWSLFSGSSVIASALGTKLNCFIPKSYRKFNPQDFYFNMRYKIPDLNTTYIEI